MRRLNWFTGVLVLSILVRLYLVFFTEGTFDITLWETHAGHILDLGLSGYYASDIANQTVFNHPPVIGKLISLIFLFCKSTGFPFKILFRLILTSLDFVVAWYLFRLFQESKHRLHVVAFYLLNPLTVIFSAYHGNTDTCIGMFILLSLYFLSRKRYVAAGIALGCGMWVKWIVLLVLPALFFAIPDFRKKVTYTASVFAAGIAGYAWHLVDAPGAMIHRVFGYHGQLLQTGAGIPVWGNRIFVNWILDLLGYGESNFLYYFLHYNQLILLAAVVAYSWLRRHQNEAMGMGRTIAGVFILFYAISNYWAFQYLVWITPFLCFLALPQMMTFTVLCSAYIYALYSLLCSSLFLLGTWDFIGHPNLSSPVLLLRDLCVIALLVMGGILFGNAIGEERRQRSDRNFAAIPRG